MTSNPASRTYKVVVVVPDNADMEVVAEQVRKFEEAHPGVKVTVKKGYGDSTGA